MNHDYLLIESRDAVADKETREFMQLGCARVKAVSEPTCMGRGAL